MGLFGSGPLRRQIQIMADELEDIRREMEKVRSSNSDLKKQVADRESATRDAKDSKKKVDKKLEKVSAARRAADQKLGDQTARMKELEGEVKQYRKDLYEAREKLDRNHGSSSRAPAESEPPADAAPEQEDEQKPPREPTPIQFFHCPEPRWSLKGLLHIR